jgi:hypothetical protein
VGSQSGNESHTMRSLIEPILSFHKLRVAVPRYLRYFSDWYRYTNLPHAESLRLEDGHPCLFDNAETTPYDPHYFYQAVWASRLLARSGVRAHVDLGSDVRFIGPLTAIIPMVTFIDVRPVKARTSGLHCIAASAAQLPFPDRSIPSLSCLHVAEHIGLGRYGDALDPTGTRRACAEMARVLAPHGDLFLSLPVGRPRVCFNAHRIHTPRQIMSYLGTLDLVEFSVVDDHGQFHEKADLDEMEHANYACGLFWLKSVR